VVEERTRLARDLHDSVTQSLFSASMLAQTAQRLWKSDPDKAKERLDRASELCSGALAEMRALIFELRPDAIREEGLVSALRKHAAARQARDGIAVEVLPNDERRLPPEVEEAAYRIAREALHNVVKHARAANAWVRLDFATDRLLLAVRDDGQGFDPLARIGRGLGLTSMRERAEELGGPLTLESEPGIGSTVRAEIPVPADEGPPTE
jgi:signal transduction histidine kinase